MDYNLEIKMTALNQASAKINAVSGSVDKLDNSAKKATKSAKDFGKSWESFGSRVNVLGQRMSGAITLPLVMLGKQSIDTAVSVERAWTRFNKVFSGTKKDADVLREAGTKFSTKFGIDVENVAEIMGEFNKAGIESKNKLIELTDQALQTSILFDTDLKSAFNGVKSVMFGFGLGVNATRDALASINIIADKTTTSEQDILDVMQKSGGVFKQNGISIREAAAMTSLLAQSNIKGTIAGNMFKTVIAKVNDATPKATKEMKAFGINVSGNAFRTSSFTDKLKALHDKQLEIFSSGNKARIADFNTAMKDLTGLRQLNRFSILVSKVDQLGGVMKLSADKTKNLEYWNKQLKEVMKSEPHNLDVMNELYRNQQAILGNKLLPLKMELLKIMTKMIEKFNSLSPETQDFIIHLGIIVAATGPVLVYLGVFITTLGFLGSVLSPVIGSIGLLNAGLVLLVPAMTLVTTYIVTRAIKAFHSLQKELKENKKQLEINEKHLDKLQSKVGSLSTKKANHQLQLAIDKARAADEAAKRLTDRYEGVKGIFAAVGDQIKTWAGDVVKAFKKVTDWLEKHKLPVKSFSTVLKQMGFASGGIVHAASGYFSQGEDTVPAMLSPGEMVLNKGQQSNLFNLLSGKSQLATSSGPTVNINVGTMIASRGEQREFARKIEELLNEDKGRY